MINLKEVYLAATESLELAHTSYRKAIKLKSGIDIRLTWINTDDFKAYASKNAGGKSFEISISNGIIEFLFSTAQICFSSPTNKIVEETMQLDAKFTDMKSLPAHDKDVYIERFVKITLMWIYFHELAHIIQDHNEIGNSVGCSLTGWDLSIEKVSISSEGAADSTDAAVRHIFEFSADSEATVQVIEFLTQTNDKHLVFKTDIWFLVLGVTSLFAFFYKGELNTTRRIVSGTHPDANLRLRLIVVSIILYCGDLQKKYARVPWVENKKSVFNIVKPAFILAVMPVALQYENFDEQVFLRSVFAFDNGVDKYVNIICEQFKIIRPIIIENYKGWSTAGVLNIRNPGILG